MSGHAFSEEYERDLKILLGEHHVTQCDGMDLLMDQEVPYTRTPDGDLIKSEFKSEIKCEDGGMSVAQQSLGFFVIENSFNSQAGHTALSTSTNGFSSLANSATIASYPTLNCSSSSSVISGHVSNCTTVTTDSLDTPTPFSSNATNGLKWETPLSIPTVVTSFLNLPTTLNNSNENNNNNNNNNKNIKTEISAPSVLLPSTSTSKPSTISVQLNSYPPSTLSSSQPQESSSTLLSPFMSSSSRLQSDSHPIVPSHPEMFAHSNWSTAVLPESRFNLTPPPSSASSSLLLSSPNQLPSLSPSTPTSFLFDISTAPAPPTQGMNHLNNCIGNNFSTNNQTFTNTNTSSLNITNGLAGSGGTILSSPNQHFLADQTLPEDIMEYTDLDRQPFSMYADSDQSLSIKVECDASFNSGLSNSIGSGSMDSVSSMTDSLSSSVDSLNLLEDPDSTIRYMQDNLMKESEILGIPFDPLQWTVQHTQSWVTSVCHNNKVADISSQFAFINGPALCNLPESSLQQFGEAGKAIWNEIECYKMATSIITRDTSPAPPGCYQVTGNDVSLHQQPQQTLVTSPCVSPAPSQCSTGQASSQSDQSDEENAPPKKVAPTQRGRPGHHKQSIPLWQFLKDLLMSKDPTHADCIRWINQQTGIFKIEDSKKVAKLWGQRKNRPMMNYDKLSRSVRQYYKKGIIKKTETTRRLVYQFCDGYL